jgi:hypothetical protein
VLVHFSVDEDEIRNELADGLGKAVDRHRIPGSLAALTPGEEPPKGMYGCVDFEKRGVAARFQRKKRQSLMLHKGAVLGLTPEGESMTGSGQAPGKLDTGVDNAG